MFHKIRIDMIMDLLENAGWEKHIIDGEVHYKTPEKFDKELLYYQKGKYKIQEAIRLQTIIDMEMLKYNEI